ncbi:hypothetical protein RUND412_008468 [Rhizina undulata]
MVLKGSYITHSLRQGDAEESNARTFVTGKVLDLRKLCMVFRFLYRSGLYRAIKYLRLILLHSPSPESNPDCDIENMIQAELVEELKNLRRIYTAIKAETIDLTNQED